MTRKNRILSVILAVLMLVSVVALTACGNTDKPAESQNAGTTAAAGGEATSAQATFPDVDYKGATFTVYARTSGGSYTAKNILAEESNGDIVNDATNTRNIRLEEKYHVKLAMKETDQPTNTVEADLKGGQLDYDIILERRNSISKHAANGYLYDFKNLDVDFTTAWWDTNCLRDLTVKDHCYLMQNSVSLARYYGIRFFYFNKQMIKDLHLDDPYQLMKDNNWTLENFLNICKNVTNTSADGGLGTHALVLETGSSNGVYMHMLVGCGVPYTKLNDNGEIECVIGESLEKIDDVFTKIKTVFSDTTHVITMDTAAKLGSGMTKGEGKYDQSRSLFAQGYFLFTHGSIAVSEQFVEMVSDFGCMPNPKYNQDQTNYAHKCDPYTLIFAIPNDAGVDMERLGIIMDYWGFLSEDTVLPNYYEVTIKARRMNDETAMKVVDIVRDTVKYEATDVFKLGNIPTALNDGYNSGSVSSKWTTNAEAINLQIKNFNDSIQ